MYHTQSVGQRCPLSCSVADHKIALIGKLQFSIYTHLSQAVDNTQLPQGSSSFWDFLSEVRTRMRELMLSLGAITHIPVPKEAKTYKHIDNKGVFVYRILQNSQELCNTLLESYDIVSNSSEDRELLSFLNRSAVFYKQTVIVLRAHLRIYEAN